MSFSVPQGKKFDTGADIKPFLDEIKADTTTVNFGGSTYSVEATKAIADKLATLDAIEVANFDDMFTGRDGPEIAESMRDILGALQGKHKLHTIDLSDNAFGIVALEPLKKFLSSHAPLEHLIFANNGFGPHSGSIIGQALVELADAKKTQQSKPLRTVVCGRNRLEAGSMENWAKFLKAHGSVETLRIYQNGIRPEGIEQLMIEGLAHSPNLRHLDLTDNTFTLRGSNAMSQVITNWKEIEEIAISDCLLSAKGAVKLCNTIAELNLPDLHTLRLQYNEIDFKGLEALKKAIHTSIPQLKLLELNGNCFSEEHSFVFDIQDIFEKRGHGELDELDDMEEPDSDEEDESEEDVQDKLESGARDAKYAEDEPAEPESDGEVADLAKDLNKTHV